MWTRRAVSTAGAHGSPDKQEKQTAQTTSWHVGGDETSVPSTGGSETRESRCSFPKEVECSSG